MDSYGNDERRRQAGCMGAQDGEWISGAGHQMERELKLRLPGEEAYLALRRSLGEPVRTENQLNRYLDASDRRIAGSRCMLRVREVDGGRRVLTFKRGVEAREGYFQAEEIEEIVVGEVDLWELPPMRAVEERFGRFEVTEVGALVNLRESYPIPGGLLELDRTSFPGGVVDYEVEVETEHPDEVLGFLHQRCGELGFPLEPQERTKYERFLRCVSPS